MVDHRHMEIDEFNELIKTHLQEYFPGKSITVEWHGGTERPFASFDRQWQVEVDNMTIWGETDPDDMSKDLISFDGPDLDKSFSIAPGVFDNDFKTEY